MLKLIKIIQKLSRFAKLFRSVKIVSVFLYGLTIFLIVVDLFKKIIICIPIVMQQIYFIWIVFYVYTVIGVELFSSLQYPYSESEKKYDLGFDFNTFLGGMLEMLNCWSGDLYKVMFDVSLKVHDNIDTSFFFCSFIFLISFLLSLITGLIWEVYLVIDDEFKEFLNQN